MATAKEHFLAVDCAQCRMSVAAPVKGSVFLAEVDYLVTLVECPKCEGALLAGQSFDPPSDLGPAERLWPSPLRALPYEAPAVLRKDFEEAQRCFARGDYTASAIMTRRFLEGLAVELGATKRDLFGKLNELKQAGRIEGQLYDWATALRLVGNDAAHDVSRRVSRQDAEDVISFAEALADYVYIFQARYDAFNKRREAAAKKPTKGK